MIIAVLALVFAMCGRLAVLTEACGGQKHWVGRWCLYQAFPLFTEMPGSPSECACAVLFVRGRPSSTTTSTAAQPCDRNALTKLHDDLVGKDLNIAPRLQILIHRCPIQNQTETENILATPMADLKTIEMQMPDGDISRRIDRTTLGGAAGIGLRGLQTPQLLVFRAKGVPFGNPSNAAFAACTELVILDVKNAGWTAMGANAFDRNVALAEVLLEHNWLANISSLEKSTALYELNLHNNQIAQLGSFSIHTDALQKLKLHSNRLTKIPNIEKATWLQILELDDNLFVEGPDLTKNIRLVRLHLQGNMLASIPNLATLTKLTALKLGDNPLGPLPSLDKNTALEELSLNSLSLSSWPSLESLTKLTRLYVQGNRLTTIPAFIGKLTKLTRLLSQDNRLTAIPAFIGKMSNLKYLDASDNDIRSLDTLTTTAAVATTQSGRRNETILLLGRNPVCVNGTIDATLGAMWFASCQSQCAGTCVFSIPWKPISVGYLGDGRCKLGCNTTACSYDGGDCLF